ncbi:kinesin family protein [Cordyceps fumosorosea ARSEF 2679]|uniref:Kinesin family protein n=1 Tax=Cordyceps fumosorosea (strain ARSEF 2679) TaxID=1081104 RepID=A0A168ASP4_CORFA|nr:kinesin family protein [Cordyceps fumosorosea ARSEF 2679]OAA69140.1 kinesin family protein [Cordyceps fumosorosea ARSEF 2679]
MPDAQSSITVAVRVRPFTIREAAQVHRAEDNTLFLGDGSLAGAPAPKLHQRGIRNVIKVMDERCLVFDPPEDSPVHKFSRSVVPASKKVKDQIFAFDRVFDENTTQSDVYEGTTKSLLDSVLDGYNATVFAYGATGCGKTHTITGTPQSPGIIFLTMQELFEKIEERSQDKATEVSLSYLEIYNETIRDLLVPGGSKAGLTLREDSNQAVTVAGLTSHHPKDVQEVMDIIVQGNEYRTVSPTQANATSSRSHAVLQVNIAQKDRNADLNEPHTMATLSIIDLAGSERASVTKNRGERLTEGANINKSLLALGSCINALCDRRQRAHVPYRNSKLTRLLKFSLGGNCKTVMIVCVSPSSAHFDETQNTLRYANRAKNIQTKVTRNVFNVNRHVKDFLVKIDEQMALITELKAQQKDAEKIFFAKFRKQYDKRDSVAREGVQRLRTAYDNAAADRHERIQNMKRLKGFERRISLLTGWVTAFDAVCEQRGEISAMPDNLCAVRKTAQGILIELEHSRQHIHQKLEHSTWERHIDTALAHSIQQLQNTEGSDTGEVNDLNREAELIKANFSREAYREVLEQEKVGDAAMLQMLLTAQFEILTSLSDILAMDEQSAVAHAKGVFAKLLQTGFTSASQVVKPDGSIAMRDPSSFLQKNSVKKSSLFGQAKLSEAPVMATSALPNAPITSPLKSSPRRRKVLSSAKKAVTFTPVKKSKKSGVRWRDDETEEGTLADFEKTPKNLKNRSPEGLLEAPIIIERPTENNTSMGCDQSTEDESTLIIPEATSLTAAKPSRFQAGFLSKSSRSSMLPAGSPLPQPPALSLNLSSSSPELENTSPLRSLDAAKRGNMSPPPLAQGAKNSPQHSLQTIVDENWPPSAASGSDSESSLLDARKLRSAMHSAKKELPRRRRRRNAAASTPALMHGAQGTTTPPGTTGTGTASPTPDLHQRPLPIVADRQLRHEVDDQVAVRRRIGPGLRSRGQPRASRRQSTATESAKRATTKSDERQTNGAAQHQPTTEAAEDDTEVPREARLLRDAHGKLIFIGDCAPLSFFQSVRQVVTSRVSPHAFAPQTSRYSVLENAPAHLPRRGGGGGSSTTSGQAPSGSPPPVHPGDLPAAVSAYLSTTTGMIDLFDNSTLLDDLLLWADRRPDDDGGASSTVKYLVLAIGLLTADEALARDYFEHARARACADMSGDDLSAETVQAFVLLTVYMLCACRINGAFLFFGVAARAAYAVGVHRTEVNARFGEAGRRRRDDLWRSLRALDLFLSTSMGRPPATSDVDCTVSYRAALDEDGGGGEVLDLLEASVQILLITETVVVEVYSRRKISLQLTEGISRQLRGWSGRWLQQLKDVVGGSAAPAAQQRPDDEARLIGACQVLATYYYSVMLVARPFLMYELCRRLSEDPSSSSSSASSPNAAATGASAKTRLADACIDAASLMVEPVLDLVERDALRHRAPMLVSWLFAAALVLGVGLLGGFGRALERHARAAIRALDHLAAADDGHAAQYSLIAQSLLTTALEDLERRERRERARRTESSSQLFGLVPHDARLSLAGGGGSGGNVTSPRDAGGNSVAAVQRTPASATGRGRPPSTAESGGGGTLRGHHHHYQHHHPAASSPMSWPAHRNSGLRPDRDVYYGGAAGASAGGAVSPHIGDLDSAFLGLSESMLHTPDTDYWNSSFGVYDGDGGGGSAVNLFPLLDAGGGIDLAHYF